MRLVSKTRDLYIKNAIFKNPGALTEDRKNVKAVRGQWSRDTVPF